MSRIFCSVFDLDYLWNGSEFFGRVVFVRVFVVLVVRLGFFGKYRLFSFMFRVDFWGVVGFVIGSGWEVGRVYFK